MVTIYSKLEQSDVSAKRIKTILAEMDYWGNYGVVLSFNPYQFPVFQPESRNLRKFIGSILVRAIQCLLKLGPVMIIKDKPLSIGKSRDHSGCIISNGKIRQQIK